jgi:hypothetical protein
MSRTVRRLLTVVLALSGVTIPVVAAAAPTPSVTATASPAARTVCATQWGSLAESVPALGGAPVTGIRAGRHTCFDRVVFDLAGRAAGYRVEYVGQVVQDGSGHTLRVPGVARLQVVLNHPAYDDRGNSTLRPAVRAAAQVADVRGFSTLRSVVYGGSFEGYTTFGVGVRARLPFRVLALDGTGGSRIVVDVAHHWS